MPAPSLGQVNTPDPYHELETKYIFGFTEGADIGAEGEKSIEFETTTASGLRGGTYAALEQEVEFEGVPTQYFGYELSAHGLGFSVNDVPGMPDAHGANFSGLSAEFRYVVIGRGPGSPVGVTVVAEPEWARIDDGGQPITDFNMTFRGISIRNSFRTGSMRRRTFSTPLTMPGRPESRGHGPQNTGYRARWPIPSRPN